MKRYTTHCKLLYVEEHDKDRLVTYMGSWNESNNKFVKEFKDGKLKYTRNEKEAKCFTDDVEGTNCMRAMIKDGATHVCVWSYDNSRLACQSINYPNGYWSKSFQPLLMTHTVAEYEKNPY